MGALACIICIAISIYLIYLSLLRVYNIANSSENVVSKDKKEELLKPIRFFVLFGLLGVILGFVSLFLLKGILQVIIPVVIILFVSTGLNRIFDEIEKFTITKKDSEILEEFLEKAERDAKEKSKR